MNYVVTEGIKAYCVDGSEVGVGLTDAGCVAVMIMPPERTGGLCVALQPEPAERLVKALQDYIAKAVALAQ